MKSMIVTNIVDSIGLGVKQDGTAKECWDSVESVCAKKSDAALSLTESEFQSIKFTGSSQDELDVLLTTIHSKAHYVRMMGGKVAEKELKNVLIRSLPTNLRWLGLQGTLSSATDLDNTFALIKMVVLSTRMPEHATVASNLTVFNTSTQKHQCTSPGCKAKYKSSHTVENCYWLGGGKEGQFPTNFGRNRLQVNLAAAPDIPPIH
jgi:hypothetical protein